MNFVSVYVSHVQLRFIDVMLIYCHGLRLCVWNCVCCFRVLCLCLRFVIHACDCLFTGCIDAFCFCLHGARMLALFVYALCSTCTSCVHVLRARLRATSLFTCHDYMLWLTFACGGIVLRVNVCYSRLFARLSICYVLSLHVACKCCAYICGGAFTFTFMFRCCV